MYGSARKSYFQMLDPIHNQGLRLCLGEFRTSPVESLYVDAHEPSLGARRAKLSLQYATKIKSLPNHPATKSALDLPRAKVPYTDFKHLITQYIFSTWQDDWNRVVVNKLHSVKPVLGDWQSSYRRCRKDEVVLCRARIGHTHLTHSYILRKDPPPLCEHCQCVLTVRHILVECNHFAQERKDIFGRRDVVESFRFHPTLNF